MRAVVPGVPRAGRGGSLPSLWHWGGLHLAVGQETQVGVSVLLQRSWASYCAPLGSELTNLLVLRESKLRTPFVFVLGKRG